MSRRAAWIGAYLAFVLAPVAAMLGPGGPAPSSFAHELGIGVGFAGLAIMAAQFGLTARFNRLATPFGIDLVYYFHRYVTVAALALVVAHPVLLVAASPATLALLDPRTAPWAVTAGSLALLALIALSVASFFRRRLGIEYDAWRRTHAVLAVAATGMALAHVHGSGRYVAFAAARALWIATALVVVALVVRVRLVRPWQLLRRPWEVARVTAERGDAWTLALAPRGHRGLAFEPGQFVWLTLRASPFAMRAQPYSLTSTPAARGRLEITVKALGDFTRTIGDVRPGEVAYVDGPYGTFTLDAAGDGRGACFVGGGIGLAPIMSLLRALAARGDRRPLVLVAATSTWDRSTFRDAIDALAPRLSGLRVVHVLEEPPPGWTGETGRVDAALLDRHLPPDRAGFDYFVCGPPGMIAAAERALAALGVPPRRCHSELFDLV
jgi:predicted ferric reductase